MESNGIRIAKVMLKRKNKVGRTRVADFKTYTAITIKMI